MVSGVDVGTFTQHCFQKCNDKAVVLEFIGTHVLEPVRVILGTSSRYCIFVYHWRGQDDNTKLILLLIG